MKVSIFFLCSFFSLCLCAQQIPSNNVLKTEGLQAFLKREVKDQISPNGALSEAQLAAYFREKFSERFFYNYKTFKQRLPHYNKLYQNQENHKQRAFDHLGKYPDSTQWVLPFNYLNGQKVNAYALRHLARQHKMVDIILLYFNEGRNPKYIRYFENQMESLNAALQSGAYEKIEDGNGVYEVFRSGYRILNWLWIHNMILNEPEYSDQDQLTTIATLLQHGQHLYERNDTFQSGNHQTRGMSALAMLSILFSDFKGTDLWYDRAMKRLGEHLDKEINKDGFQFERSVHYHMSDINNYFYVYQLAKQNRIQIANDWTVKLRGLFSTLVKIAYPDKSAPVLQDDTEIPWAEKNDISGVMTLGYLLFEDPEFGYFASNRVNERMYWFLSQTQVQMLENIQRKKPSYGSLAFTDTHYYIMREGWNVNDKMMVISSGLDDKKPDHQHGDMLGIQAIANGHAILPNYQVRYSLADFELFKNSKVKNVALVDNEMQGKKWTSNKGGSGFGKFGGLPNPKVIAWSTNDNFDLFIGSHDGFEDVGVDYTRQVVFIKDDFWIVKDNFSSESAHKYKQVWQGHYTHENGPNLLRATAPDASGHDILQLSKLDTVAGYGTRGKNWSVVSKKGQKNFSFLTVVYPYRGYSNRIDETKDKFTFYDWEVNMTNWKMAGENPISISKDNQFYFFGIKDLKFEDLNIQTNLETDLFIQLSGNKLQLHALGTEKSTLTIAGKNRKETKMELEPGKVLEFTRNQ
ncbi:heparinase II/III family protein [Flagellimonas algicola]|uniref:Heparinase n=1 Tax=Flagellimonas algicola TaxID=2583815 RepID=A0ABY2WMV3_9FLAO|nr:heparinase II/III family protein [Allomuricauda algicola]TMU56090.1 heparinase [Allomuricauda algicola]